MNLKDLPDPSEKTNSVAEAHAVYTDPAAWPGVVLNGLYPQRVAVDYSHCLVSVRGDHSRKKSR